MTPQEFAEIAKVDIEARKASGNRVCPGYGDYGFVKGKQRQTGCVVCAVGAIALERGDPNYRGQFADAINSVHRALGIYPRDLIAFANGFEDPSENPTTVGIMRNEWYQEGQRLGWWAKENA